MVLMNSLCALFSPSYNNKLTRNECLDSRHISSYFLGCIINHVTEEKETALFECRRFSKNCNSRKDGVGHKESSTMKILIIRIVVDNKELEISYPIIPGSRETTIKSKGKMEILPFNFKPSFDTEYIFVENLILKSDGCGGKVQYQKRPEEIETKTTLWRV